jgi:hypothetical protein
MNQAEPNEFGQGAIDRCRGIEAERVNNFIRTQRLLSTSQMLKDKLLIAPQLVVCTLAPQRQAFLLRNFISKTRLISGVMLYYNITLSTPMPTDEP